MDIKLGKGIFARGVHPDDQKHWSKNLPIEVLPNPKELLIPFLQHIGAPCETSLKPRQKLEAGSIIANSEKFISAPIHASLAGTNGMLTKTTLPNGRHIDTMPIKVDNPDQVETNLWEQIKSKNWPLTSLDKYIPNQIKENTKNAGIVGMGGAAFPTHVKLTTNEKKPIDTILINGCECEPYLTSDYRLMCEAPYAIIMGALLAAKCVNAKNIIIAIEDNKPEAIKNLQMAAKETNVKVFPVKTKYPMGGEKQLIVAILDKEVPINGLPLDVGVIVLNVGTASSIAQATINEKPLTHRVISISGSGINQPKNLFVPIGTTYSQIIEYCGGLKSNTARVISGGPMMGFTIGDLNTPITKGTSGIVVLTDSDINLIEETACVRCGKCVDVCPLNLVPTKIAHASKFEDWDLAKTYYITACCECGCCTYTCPAGIPLVQLMRTGKAKLPKE